MAAQPIQEFVQILTRIEPMQNAIEAYEAFDRREPGWIKVELKPATPAA